MDYYTRQKLAEQGFYDRFPTQADYEAHCKQSIVYRARCTVGFHTWVEDVPGAYTGYVRCACCNKRDFEFVA